MWINTDEALFNASRYKIVIDMPPRPTGEATVRAVGMMSVNIFSGPPEECAALYQAICDAISQGWELIHVPLWKEKYDQINSKVSALSTDKAI